MMGIIDEADGDRTDIDGSKAMNATGNMSYLPVGSRTGCKRKKNGATLWICVLMANWISVQSQRLNIQDCKAAFGMSTYGIPDSAITASSYSEALDARPEYARVRLERGGGAWCPAQEITRGSREYLQIDLGQLKVISTVETQGRFGEGQGQEFADQYYIEYQREAGGPWFRFRSRRKQDIFAGNTNTYIAEVQSVSPPIIARKIRFFPYSTHSESVCMRVEMYGCDWTQGIVSYDMSDGEPRGSDILLIDDTYDGNNTDEYLSGGLGQLTDGVEGQDNFRLDPEGLGIRGYNWIGWRNDTETPSGPVAIVFKFDALRNFTALHIHTNNLYTKGVTAFQTAKVYFSNDKINFGRDPIVLDYMPDPAVAYARTIIVELQHRVSRYVKVELYFHSKWILISEVYFESEYVEQDTPPTVQLPEPTPAPVMTTGAAVSPRSTTAPQHHVEQGGGENSNPDPDVPDDKPADNDQDKEAERTTSAMYTEVPKARQSLDDEYIGIIIGALAALILILFAIILYIILRHRRHKYNNNHQTMKSIEPRHVTLNLSDIRNNMINEKLSNGNMYNCVATSDGDSDREGVCCPSLHGSNSDPAVGAGRCNGVQARSLPQLPQTPDSADTSTSRDYAIPGDIPKTSLIVNLPPPGAATTPLATLSHAPINPAYQGTLYRQGRGQSAASLLTTGSPAMTPATASPYAMTEAKSPAQSIQGASGNNVYAVPGGNIDLLWTEDFSLVELPRENLKFVEKLGEGQFGEVHLCESMRLGELLGGDFINRTGSAMLVAVKMLRPNATPSVRADFDKEVKLMARLKDPNIVRALGVITRDEPLCVVVEYVKFGDLNQFLHQHVLEGSGTMTKRKHTKALSNACLVYMASQVASGMKYLENLNVVHRDLATRNCLVGYNYTIKISDFGMSRSLYSNDYYRMEGKAVLPIRWMAWESIVLGKFSPKSDVWSFGVTLWEILTFARIQPFDTMTDAQVIDNCSHFYQADGLEVTLPQPTGAPREIYDLMQECWNRDEIQRPAFREIHMFLQRKNMGYNPNDIVPNGTRVNIPLV